MKNEGVERNDTCVHVLSCFGGIWISTTLWTVAHQAPQSMRFSRRKYWSGLPFPAPGNLLDPRIKLKSPMSPALQVDFFTAEPPRGIQPSATCSFCPLTLFKTNRILPLFQAGKSHSPLKAPWNLTFKLCRVTEERMLCLKGICKHLCLLWRILKPASGHLSSEVN